MQGANVTKAEEYAKAKQNLRFAERVVGKIGKSYLGGGGGVGSVVKATAHVEVYHQERDGAANYHHEKALDEALADVLFRRSTELLAEAIDVLKARVKVAAAAAATELRQVMEDAEA